MTKFLDYAYEDGIYYEGKRIKQDETLKLLIKNGLKRSLEAISDDSNEKYGVDSITAKKVAKVVAIAAATTLVSAALTPAAGLVVAEMAGGAPITGQLIGKAGEAAIQGVKNLADPANLATKVAKKALTKGKKLID